METHSNAGFHYHSYSFVLGGQIWHSVTWRITPVGGIFKDHIALTHVGLQPQPHWKSNAMVTELGKMETGLFLDPSIIDISISRKS